MPTPDEVKKAWKALCRIHHPDVEGGSDEMFREVTHAYNMLTNPKYRFEQVNKNQPMNLDIRGQEVITFEQAFFGYSFTRHFVKMENDEKGVRIAKEEWEVETLDVVIPPGNMQGGDMLFTGKGIKCGDAVGNVVLSIAIQPHPKFRVDPKGNIVAQEHFPLDTLVKGGSVEVQTMYGLKTVKIKPGSKPHDTVAIKRDGVNGADHIITMDAIYPTSEDLKGEAWKGLDINWELDEELKKEREEEQKYQQIFFSGQSYTIRF